MLSNNVRLPAKQIAKIRGVKDGYEIRADTLRLYYLDVQNKRIIICLGGLKKNQKKDIDRFKRLVSYLQKELNDEGELKNQE